MSTSHDPAAEVYRQAQALNHARMEAIQPLAELIAHREQLRHQLRDTEDQYGRLYTEAERVGWTSDELQALGAEEPAKRPRGRRPSKRRNTRRSARTPSDTSPDATDAESGSDTESDTSSGTGPIPEQGTGSEGLGSAMS